jgi:hypothetical protein
MSWEVDGRASTQDVCAQDTRGHHYLKLAQFRNVRLLLVPSCRTCSTRRVTPTVRSSPVAGAASSSSSRGSSGARTRTSTPGSGSSDGRAVVIVTVASCCGCSHTFAACTGGRVDLHASFVFRGKLRCNLSYTIGDAQCCGTGLPRFGAVISDLVHCAYRTEIALDSVRVRKIWAERGIKQTTLYQLYGVSPSCCVTGKKSKREKES